MSTQGDVAVRVDGETIKAWYENEANMCFFSNKSGVAQSTGAVVVVDSGTDKAFKTTTNVDDQTVLGVIPQVDDVNGTASDQSIANNGSGYVQFAGFIAKLNVQGNVTRGHYLRCSATAGRAEDAGAAPTQGSFAMAVSGYLGTSGQVQAIMVPRNISVPPPGKNLSSAESTDSTNRSTSSSSFQTAWSASYTTHAGGTLLMIFYASLGADGDVSTDLGINVDGGSDVLLAHQMSKLGVSISITLAKLFTGLSAAAHTFNFRFKNGDGTTTITLWNSIVAGRVQFVEYY